MSPDEALVEPERRQWAEYQRLCAGRRLFQPLERQGFSPKESVERFERRLRGLPRFFQMKREMAQRLAELRAKRDRGEITREKFEFERARREMEFQKLIERNFPPGYIPGNLENELSNARCALARARWEYLIWLRTGRVPGRLHQKP
jgi:hypothetical protein